MDRIVEANVLLGMISETIAKARLLKNKIKSHYNIDDAELQTRTLEKEMSENLIKLEQLENI